MNKFDDGCQSDVIWGDSAKTLPEWCKRNKDIHVDFYHVDGDHSFEYAHMDFENCLNHGKKNSIFILDDYTQFPFSVGRATNKLFVENADGVRNFQTMS